MEPQTFYSKSGKEITLRVQTNNDAPALLEYINNLIDEDIDILINRKLTLSEEENYVRECSESMEKGESLHVTAWDGDILIGKSQIKFGDFKERHIAGFGISLKNGYRSDGIGKKLADVVLDWAKNQKEIEKVYLTVFGRNERAISLYHKLGFVEFGRLPDGVKSGNIYVDTIYMYLNTHS
ncbi:MAG: hypothetical protein COV59_05480 [Candidatus Magasanikbacteria bacterium CG11_big_fil_rev_8_21_14_0_20_39_34]|uniref:N-acetyltransferase domain-containing protein n=1 Tax=Candidatus Magasanikbacteria bacterium CG11_big_fil_rev_8_21_14_0_20_39_34 TaxID=1974653 RepID=A0A2H0N3Y8_9BACT|nr:MAG: hypothetical protein COV59_05480 [Candidatus Magasanikbacteria bacterium CG11_big_fil_rev_8_21_14_0_20_39_34]